MQDILIQQVKVATDRYRNETKYGDIDSLADSIRSIGTIHSIVLDRQNNLIAGGRRMRAFQSLGMTTLSHDAVLRPGVGSFVYADEVPDHIKIEAELDENLHRLDCDWIDNCLMIDRVHTLKKRQNLKWGFRQTAALFENKTGFTRSNINYAVRVAKLLRANDAEVLACKAFSDAISLLVKRKEDSALAELQRRVDVNKVVANVKPTALTSTPVFSGALASILDSIDKTPVVPGTTPLPLQPTEAPIAVPATVVPLSSMFHNGDSLAYMATLSDASFDHIVTDIPYGIDMDNLDEASISQMRATHDVEQNVSMFSPFLTQSFRLIKDGGFLVFFYDLDHHEKLQSLATSVGFAVQRWPLIAHKTSASRNQAAQYNFTKNFEVAMVCRKPGAVLRKPQLSSVWSGDFSAERTLYSNPFAKPFELWKWIYDAIAFPGQTVFDPYVGEGSASRAAANCGLVPFGSELDLSRYNRCMENMRKVYAVIHKSNVQFT